MVEQTSKRSMSSEWQPHDLVLEAQLLYDYDTATKLYTTGGNSEKTLLIARESHEYDHERNPSAGQWIGSCSLRISVCFCRMQRAIQIPRRFDCTFTRTRGEERDTSMPPM